MNTYTCIDRCKRRTEREKYCRSIDVFTVEVTWVGERWAWIANLGEIWDHLRRFTVVHHVTLRQQHRHVKQLEYIRPKIKA